MLLTDLLNAFAASVTSETSTTAEQPSKDLLSLISSLLMPHKDAVLGMLAVGLKSSSTRLPAVHGFSSLTRIPTLLTDTELGYIVLEAGEFVGKEPDEVEDVTYVTSLRMSAPCFLPEDIDVVSELMSSHYCPRSPSLLHTISQIKLSLHSLPCSLNRHLLEMLSPSVRSIGVFFAP